MQYIHILYAIAFHTKLGNNRNIKMEVKDKQSEYSLT